MSRTITIGDLKICPNCQQPLPYRIIFDPASGHYELWLECENCHLRTDHVFIGKVNLKIDYPGDRQEIKENHE